MDENISFFVCFLHPHDNDLGVSKLPSTLVGILNGLLADWPSVLAGVDCP